MSKAEATRDRILDAALDIFSNKGYHDTRMDEIVDSVGDVERLDLLPLPEQGAAVSGAG